MAALGLGRSPCTKKGREGGQVSESRKRTSLPQCRKAYIAGEPEEECMRYGPSPEIEINYL